MSISNTDKTCFVIAPIGKEGSETRKHSDQVLEYIIKPAMEDCGYEAKRADEISTLGIITTNIIQRIFDAPLVIAVLTDHNPNVFYELAIRHAARKPVIQLIKHDQEIPFDVNQQNTIKYELDLPGAKACIEKIIEQVSAINQHDKEINNPISVAIDLQALGRSKDPLAQSYAEIISMLQGITQQLNVMRRQLPVSDSMRTFSKVLRATTGTSNKVFVNALLEEAIESAVSTSDIASAQSFIKLYNIFNKLENASEPPVTEQQTENTNEEITPSTVVEWTENEQ